MAFECRLLGVVRLSIFGRFVFLESAISIRFVWDFSEIWICGLYIADTHVNEHTYNVIGDGDKRPCGYGWVYFESFEG